MLNELLMYSYVSKAVFQLMHKHVGTAHVYPHLTGVYTNRQAMHLQRIFTIQRRLHGMERHLSRCVDLNVSRSRCAFRCVDLQML